MFETRKHLPLHPLKFDLIEMKSQGVNIPLKQDWEHRWCTLPVDIQNIYDKIYNFEVFDDDIFVVTFPRSGTTWMQETAWLLLNDLNFEKANEVILSSRSVYLEYCILKDPMAYNSIELAANSPRPRLIKTHLPASLIPHQIWTKKAKIIYCARNPKDTVLSNYHFYKDLDMINIPIDRFVDYFINDDLIYTPYWPHVLDFWQMRHDPKIFFITYESMKCNLTDVIVKLNEFIGKAILSTDEIQNLLQHLRFDKMKENIKINATERIEARTNNLSSNFEFLRRGIVGAYNDEMASENQQKIDEYTTKCLKDFGIKESDIFDNVTQI